MFKTLSVVFLVVFAAGCGIQAKTYVMTKERVGIDYKGGNAGYIDGKPQYTEPEKKTRKVYVLELTKPVPESEVKKIEEMTQTQAASSTTTAAAETATAPAAQEQVQPASAPAETAVAAAPAEPAVQTPAAAEAVTYTVKKDDTLQKIAKKFYGSYGKWMKIYDANKSAIKNPNFVKPGTVLTIPADDKK